jgi:hypothetical protein
MSSIDQLTPEKRRKFYLVMTFMFGVPFTVTGLWFLVRADVFKHPELILSSPRGFGFFLGLAICGIALLIWATILILRKKA